MNSLGIVFLGLIALCSLAQTAFLILLALKGVQLARRLDQLQDRIDRDLRATLEHIARVTRNLAEVSDTAVLQVRRIDDFLADTVEKIEDTTATVRRLILRPLSLLVDIAAFLKGVRRALEVYHQLRNADDEHLLP
jgi:hypothetical protein